MSESKVIEIVQRCEQGLKLGAAKFEPGNLVTTFTNPGDKEPEAFRFVGKPGNQDLHIAQWIAAKMVKAGVAKWVEPDSGA